MPSEGYINIRYNGKCAGCSSPHPYLDKKTGVWCAHCWGKLRLVSKLKEDGTEIKNHYTWVIVGQMASRPMLGTEASRDGS